MKIQMAVVVGSNGFWHVVPFQYEQTDWSFASECIGTFEQGEFIAPEETRYIVSAEVDVPEPKDRSAKKIEGEAVKA